MITAPGRPVTRQATTPVIATMSAMTDNTTNSCFEVWTALGVP